MDEQEIFKRLNTITSNFRELLKNELDARWESIKIDLTKSASYEVLFALISRQCTLVYQLSFSYFSWNENILPVVMRCMAENHINICWLMEDLEVRSKKFVDYGLGKDTKFLEYLKTKKDKTQLDNAFIQNLESLINQQQFTHLTKINIGSWNFSNVRKTAISSGNKDFYDLYYEINSFAVHSTWNYIRTRNLKVCKNPLHKDHRIPVINEPESEIFLFLILSGMLNSTFEEFDNKMGIKVKPNSSHTFLKNSFAELGVFVQQPDSN